MKYCIATLLLLNGLAAGQESSALSLKTHIGLPNVDGRMDHFAVDVKGQRLFVSALGNHTAEVIDLQAGRRLRTLSTVGCRRLWSGWSRKCASRRRAIRTSTSRAP